MCHRQGRSPRFVVLGVRSLPFWDYFPLAHAWGKLAFGAAFPAFRSPRLGRAQVRNSGISRPNAPSGVSYRWESLLVSHAPTTTGPKTPRLRPIFVTARNFLSLVENSLFTIYC